MFLLIHRSASVVHQTDAETVFAGAPALSCFVLQAGFLTPCLEDKTPGNIHYAGTPPHELSVGTLGSL